MVDRFFNSIPNGGVADDEWLFLDGVAYTLLSGFIIEGQYHLSDWSIGGSCTGWSSCWLINGAMFAVARGFYAFPD